MSNFPVDLNTLPIMNQFLRMLRVVSDINPNDIILNLKIDEIYLSKIERSDMEITLTLINSYAKHFQISPSSLLKGYEKIKSKLAAMDSSPTTRHRTINEMTMKFLVNSEKEQNEPPF